MSKNGPDLSTYIAIGDSITSGYADGALYYKGQLHSYPNLLAAQFRFSGGNGFKQALLDKESEGIGFYGRSRLSLRKENTENGSARFYLSYLSPQGDINALSSNCFQSSGPFHNLGIPGLKSMTALLPGYGNPENGAGNYNPFFSRQASDLQKASVLSDALSLKPSFFSLFIGNNDVLAYALSGCTTDAITPASGPGPEPNFESCVRIIVEQLTATGAKGIICGIPDISGIPYFNTIPYNGLLPDRQKGTQAFVIQSSVNDPAEIRQARKGDLILMDILLDPDALRYLGGEIPIPKCHVITGEEVSLIQDTIAQYNRILRSIAAEKKLAFVDTVTFIKKPGSDRNYDPVSFGIHFKKNQIFSLDGIHLTPLGQALLANEFIKAINRTYGAFIPKISLSKYRKISYIG
jgi:hypothetical protein